MSETPVEGSAIKSGALSTPPVYFKDWWTQVDKVDKAWTLQDMVYYALRCDFDRDADERRLSDWLSNNCDSYLVVYEEVDGENPHVHAIASSAKALDALRKSFKRSFEEKRGNGAYSLKPCTGDIDAYVAYMCKGRSPEEGADVVVRQGFDFSEERVAAAHSRYWDTNERLRAASKARSAMSGASLVEVIEKLCREEGVMAYDRKGIARVYIREMKKARKAINIFQAKAVVNGVSVALDDEDGGATEDIVGAISAL